MEENPVNREIKRIDAWLAKSGVSESTLGLFACANARAVSRVRSGTGSVKSLRRIIKYITDNPVKG